MKSTEIKNQFIELRAKNKSYEEIARTLKISKSTCTAWNKEFKEEISTLKRDELNSLYTQYHMTREARIKQLGNTLNDINDALKEADLSEIAPEKLLEYKLKYHEALKDDYIHPVEDVEIKEGTLIEDTIKIMSDLYNRVRRGEISDQQAQKEINTISNLLKAYETNGLQKQIDLLQEMAGGQF